MKNICPQNQRPCIHCGRCNHATSSKCRECGNHPKRGPKRERIQKAVKLDKPKPIEEKISLPIEPTLSIICAVRSRSGRGIRMKNFFSSLAFQTDKNFELVIIDYGSKPKYQKEIFKLCRRYRFEYYYVGAEKWNSPRALNIGISKARNNYILHTNIDMIFRRDFIEIIKRKLKPNRFIWTVPTFLNRYVYEMLHTINFKGDWEKLNSKKYFRTDWCGHATGAIQCTTKDWLIKVGGFDERFCPYGPADLDLWTRAEKDNMMMIRLQRRDDNRLAICAHQWHPLSKYFKKVQTDFIPNKRKTLSKTFQDMVGKEIIKKSDVFPNFSSKKFSVFVPISRSGRALDRCLKSIKRQEPDEVRIYIDPLKITKRKREGIMKKIIDIIPTAKIFIQALTSDSDEQRCRRKQKHALKKIKNMREGRLSSSALSKLVRQRKKITREYEEMGNEWNLHHSGHPDCVRNLHRDILECENKWVVRVDDDDEIIGNVREILSNFAENDVGIIHGNRECGLVDTKNIKGQSVKRGLCEKCGKSEFLKFSNKTVFCGNCKFTTDYKIKNKKIFVVNYGRCIESPEKVNYINGSVVILNRDAFKEVHSNICHEPWQDFRRWYWIMRGGYKAQYAPVLFGRIFKHMTPDPRRLAEGGGKTWVKITKKLNKKPVRLVI